MKFFILMLSVFSMLLLSACEQEKHEGTGDLQAAIEKIKIQIQENFNSKQPPPSEENK